MKRFLILTAVILIWCCLGSEIPAAKPPVVIMSDISHFWQAFDQLSYQHSSKDSITVIQSLYVDRASAGLREYMKAANCYALEYLDVIRRRRQDYLAIRNQSLAIISQKHQLIIKLDRLRQLYPSFKPPLTCFAIGKFEVGGTAFGNMLYIGCETDLQHHVGIVPQAVHEIAHSQQQSEPKTNLELAMIEGGAEFINYHVTRERTIPAAWSYGLKNEHALWEEFRKELNSPIDTRWFSDAPDKAADSPGSLAYFIGQRICESYYQRQGNKTAAFARIVQMKKPEEILALSGYNP